MGETGFGRRLLLVIGVLGAIALVLRLADVLLLVFAALLAALLLRAIAEPLQTRLRLAHGPSIVLAAVLVLAMLAGGIWVLGRQVELQLISLAGLLPAAWRDLEGHLSASPGGLMVLDALRDLPRLQPAALSAAPRYALDLAGSAAAAVIVSFAGLYLALSPRAYAEGLLSLIPASARPRVAEVLGAMGHALRRWLLGQVISMVLVGLSTGIGLWLVGAPSPIGLGVLAGLAQFIPVIGPMVAAIPGLVLGLAGGPTHFALVLLVYVGASQFEANLITPLILRQMVELPMAVTLFAVLAMGVLLGPLGALLATPLAVAAHVLVRMVYVEGLLARPQAGAA